MSRARAYCFTVNNYTEQDVQAVTDLAGQDARYVVVGREKGVNGTPHLQGYVYFNEAKSFSSVKKKLPRAHIEVTKGSPSDNRKYCTKENDILVEYGQLPSQGKRSDLAAAVEAVKRGGVRAAARECPEVYVKYSRGLQDLERQLEEIPRDDDFVPRPWQARVLDIIKQPANQRTIVWVWETVGNVGKTRLVNHIVRSHGGTLLEGKVADMAHAYNKEPVVMFDVPRTAIENINHLCGFAEKLKGGMLFSSKYESKLKVFNPPHVLFFANIPPPRDVWSVDRLLEIDLNEYVREYDPIEKEYVDVV